MAENQGIYEYQYLVIHGSLAQAQSQGYPDPKGGQYTSHNGNPAFCMHLKVSDFYRNPDGSVGFTIDEAELRGLMPPSKYFGYPFTIHASIIVGNVDDYGGNYQSMLQNCTSYSKTELFHKPNYADNTSDSQRKQWDDKHYRMSSPVTLSAPSNEFNKTYIVIWILSVCTCDQSGVQTPVYIDDISEYVPPPQGGYIWRRFGNSAAQDPVGNSINPEKLDGDWHLVKPVYAVDNVGGVKSWIDVEGGAPL